MIDAHTLAPAGSTGTGAGTPVKISGGYEAVAMEITSTAGGTSASVKFQGSMDGSNWYDVFYVTDASDTAAQSARTLNPSSSLIQWLSNPVARKWNYIRLNVVSNTGITYSSKLYGIQAGS